MASWWRLLSSSTWFNRPSQFFPNARPAGGFLFGNPSSGPVPEDCANLLQELGTKKTRPNVYLGRLFYFIQIPFSELTFLEADMQAITSKFFLALESSA